MKKEYQIFKLGLIKPVDAWRGNIKTGYFEAGNDNETWTRICDWKIESNDPREHTFDVSPTTARYIRLVITDTFDYDNPEIGPESGARCDIAEFKVWGQ